MSEQLRRHKKTINDYRASVFASVFLRHLIEEKWDLGHEFFFGGNIDDEKDDSPDFVIKSEESRDILGDLKKSLARKELSGDNTLDELIEEYGEDYLLNDLCRDLEEDAEKYTQSYSHISDPHDFFFFYRGLYDNVPSIWEALSDIPENHQIAGLSYDIIHGRKKALSINLDFGEFSNDTLNQKIKFSDTEYPYEEIPEIVLENEIFVVEENHSTPLGYLIFILWTAVFEELEQKPQEDLILDRFEKEQTGEITKMDFELGELINLLNEKYHVPFYDSDPRGGTRHQFSDQRVEEAIDAMAKIDEIDVEKEEGDRTTITVEYGVLSKGDRDALETIVEKMKENNIGVFEPEEEEKAREEYQLALFDFPTE